jgi:cyclopropane fatty-acyl-phospholipid synthase-like methyltransferase
MNNSEWFKDWFNSPYYHLLYNNRNENEAVFFIDNLCKKLQLESHSKIWDLACGKGRHSLALHQKGFNVTGTDLAANSINEASKNTNETLSFFVHDMRQPFKLNYFDAVFNLFTSIGYFNNFNDNYTVFKNVSNALVDKGVFLIDFFNSEKTAAALIPETIEKRGDITFYISRKIISNQIVKHIEFSDSNKNYYFEESVTLLNLTDFNNFALEANLKVEEVFGNYLLEPYNEKTSDRLIIKFIK